jgi:hypothetical protein
MAGKEIIKLSGEKDLLQIISTSANDRKKIEYKPRLPEQSEEGVQEFLRDAVSFANSQGGHIMYGVTAMEGSAIDLPGLDRADVEESLPWMDRALHTGVAPQIPGLQYSLAPLDNGGCVLTLTVPKTWAGPHMVSFRQSSRFYSRNSSGPYLLDVDELRTAFVLGETLGEKLRAFRLDRVSAILNRDVSIKLTPAPKTVLHILPVGSFRTGYRIDIEAVSKYEELIRPMMATGLVSHYNYHGFVNFSSMEKHAFSYLQVFRNGCLEAVEGQMLEDKDGRKLIHSVDYEAEIIQCGSRLMELLRRMEVDPPYMVMLSILGVRGYTMFVESMRWQSQSRQIERDSLYLDEVVVDNPDQEFSHTMHPVFDQLWNACGWAGSMNYDKEGMWRPYKHES